MDILSQILRFPSRRRREMSSVIKSLLRIRGEASAIKLTHEILELYAAADDDGRREFFRFLLNELGPDQAALHQAIAAYQKTPSPQNYVTLFETVEPQRQDLIRTLNWAPHGTSSLISMRADLLRFARDEQELKLVDHDFLHLLTSWFNRGFLELKRIDWNTPAFILEKLIRYESVHEIKDWQDLQRRLASDRRCFAFFHPQLPDEPLIFVEVALTEGIVSKIDAVLEHPALDGEDAQSNAPDTAIFYSINNCQKGLRGISFGNFLIKQVADELADEIGTLKRFATLSPIPGFRAWLEPIRRDRSAEWLPPEDYMTLADLDSDGWHENETKSNTLRPLMERLCIRYLVEEKRDDEPRDPVARFHLSNGARIEQINWLGDRSDNGMRQSYGMLVNYLYDRRAVIKNHEAYVGKGAIVTSSMISSTPRFSGVG